MSNPEFSNSFRVRLEPVEKVKNTFLCHLGNYNNGCKSNVIVFVIVNKQKFN